MARAGSGSGRPSGMHSPSRSGSSHNSRARNSNPSQNRRAGSGSGGYRPTNTYYYSNPDTTRTTNLDRRPPAPPARVAPPPPPRPAPPKPPMYDIDPVLESCRTIHAMVDEEELNLAAVKANWQMHKARKADRERETAGFLDGLMDIIGPIFLPLVGLLLVVWIIWSAIAGAFPPRTVEREKLDTNIPFQTDCIIDELGWFDDIPGTAERLREFYDATGIQPYIYLRAYDETLKSDTAKLNFADQWYEDNITNKGTFLFVYFAEKNQDSDVGVMCYVDSAQIISVMDDDAGEIFWSYVDSYWYSDMSTDDLFVQSFNNTAERIMGPTTSQITGPIFLKVLAIGAGILMVIVIGYTIFWFVESKREREEDEAKERELILNTPLEVLIEDNVPVPEPEPEEEDELLSKYTY